MLYAFGRKSDVWVQMREDVNIVAIRGIWGYRMAIIGIIAAGDRPNSSYTICIISIKTVYAIYCIPGISYSYFY